MPKRILRGCQLPMFGMQQLQLRLFGHVAVQNIRKDNIQQTLREGRVQQVGSNTTNHLKQHNGHYFQIADTFIA